MTYWTQILSAFKSFETLKSLYTLLCLIINIMLNRTFQRKEKPIYGLPITQSINEILSASDILHFQKEHELNKPCSASVQLPLASR